MTDLTAWQQTSSPTQGRVIYRRHLQDPHDGSGRLARTDTVAEGGPSRINAVHLLAGEEVVTVGIGTDADGDGSAPHVDHWLSIRQGPDGRLQVRAWREGPKGGPGEDLALGAPPAEWWQP